MRKLEDCYILSNGIEIPCVGYGTYKLLPTNHGKECIKQAIETGYRHIDTAAVYGNEKCVGRAVRECSIERERLFITSKLWNTKQGYPKTVKAFRKTLKKLNLDYLDLYLIHWPLKSDNWQEMVLGTWKAFEEFYEQGLIRSIGVSNFEKSHLEFLLSVAKIPPMINQIEFHPGKLQEETVAFCKQNNIVVEAWAPLGRGKILDHPVLLALAAKHKKTPAQICLRWCIQKGTLPLPKSATLSRIEENADIFDFLLNKQDMAEIDQIKIEE